jgi:hypothetical protein
MHCMLCVSKHPAQAAQHDGGMCLPGRLLHGRQVVLGRHWNLVQPAEAPGSVPAALQHSRKSWAASCRQAPKDTSYLTSHSAALLLTDRMLAHGGTGMRVSLICFDTASFPSMQQWYLGSRGLPASMASHWRVAVTAEGIWS